MITIIFSKENSQRDYSRVGYVSKTKEEFHLLLLLFQNCLLSYLIYQIHPTFIF